MEAQKLTAADLEKGDTLIDTEGHGQTNPYGPDLTDEIVVKKPWHGDNWFVAPKVENGLTSSKGFVLTHDELDEGLESGRYEPVDCEAHRSIDVDALPVDPDTDVYIRFGDLPEGGRSTNHVDGSKEDGISAYEATLESVQPDVDAPGVYVPHGNKIQQILFLAKRDTYLVTGEEVGRGEDGEPLLRDAEIVCELRSPKGVSGFVPAEEN